MVRATVVTYEEPVDNKYTDYQIENSMTVLVFESLHSSGPWMHAFWLLISVIHPFLSACCPLAVCKLDATEFSMVFIPSVLLYLLCTL